MTTLRSADLRSVLDVVYLLNRDGAGGAGLTEVLGELGRLLGADVASYTRVDHRTNALVGAAVNPVDQDLSGSPGFHVVFDQHPALAAYRSGRLALDRSIAWSELSEAASLRKLPLYVDYYEAVAPGTSWCAWSASTAGTEPAWPSIAIAGASRTATTRSSTW